MRHSKSLKRSLDRELVYSDINSIPLSVWWKVKESGNLVHLYKDKPPKLVNPAFLSDIYIEILDQYIKILDLEPDIARRKNLMLEEAIASIEVAMGNSFAQNTVNMRQQDLKRYEETDGADMSRGEELALVSRKMGFSINPDKTTLGTYCGYIKIAKKDG